MTCFFSLLKYRLSPDITPSLFKQTCSPANDGSNEVTNFALFSQVIEIQIVFTGLGTVILYIGMMNEIKVGSMTMNSFQFLLGKIQTIIIEINSY